MTPGCFKERFNQENFLAVQVHTDLLIAIPWKRDVLVSALSIHCMAAFSKVRPRVQSKPCGQAVASILDSRNSSPLFFFKHFMCLRPDAELLIDM